MLVVAGLVAVMLAAAHSYLGERYILIRLFRQENLPRLFGGTWFTRRVIRLAWHVTSVAWIGFGAILFALANPGDDIQRQILYIISGTFLVSGVISIVLTNARHLSWIVFWLIAGISFYYAGAI